MNARNFLFIQKYNSNANKRFADDKLYTKTFLQSRGVGVAKTFYTLKNYAQLEQMTPKAFPNSFVIKPNQGFGGEGILIIEERVKDQFRTISGDVLSWEEIYLHLASILDGKYAISSSRDQAIVEERLEIDDNLQPLIAAGGVPDVRIIVFNQVPVMAMLRLPTQESGGKGNLQLGAIGVGIDITTGKATFGYQNGKFLRRLPNGDPISGIYINDWDEVLLTASKIQQSTNIGYVGVDLVPTKTGVKALEVNARPGLKIQICNKIPLKDRLDRVLEHNVLNPEQGVELAKRLFTQKWSDVAQTESEKPIIGLKEPMTVYSEGVQFFYAKIDPYASENLIRPDVDLEEGLLDISIQGKRLRLPFKHAYFEEDYDAVLAGKSLSDFYIDVTVENEIDTSVIENIQEKMLLSVDRRVSEIDERLKFMTYFKPLNLSEIKEAFLEHKNFNPQFSYKPVDPDFFHDLKRDLAKIPTVDHPLMPLYKKKIDELILKIDLIEARDTEKLSKISEKLYGKVDYPLYKSAVSTIKKYNPKEGQEETKKLKAQDVQKIIESFLKDKHLEHWRVQIIEGAAANMSVSKKGIVFIGEDIEVTENHLQALIAHEIETHVYRAENAKPQKFKMLQRGFADYLETEEGLAVYNQSNLGIDFGEKEIWPALRVVGAYMGKKMSFLELFHYLQDTFGVCDNTAWSTCIKVKRGLSDTALLTSFTKDTIYFTGRKKVESFMKDATKEDVCLLYSGKIGIKDIEFIREIDLIKPKYISSYLEATLKEE